MRTTCGAAIALPLAAGCADEGEPASGAPGGFGGRPATVVVAVQAAGRQTALDALWGGKRLCMRMSYSWSCVT